jgi:ABC-type lipoprotein release transport system permease subunit
MRLMGCILKIVGAIIGIIILIFVVTHISEIWQFFEQLIGSS